MMPLASAVAAAAGAVLLFWHRTVGWFRRVLRTMARWLSGQTS